MSKEIWTAAMHQPVDTRKLDAFAREIVVAALDLQTAYRGNGGHNGQLSNLIQKVETYRLEVFKQLLSPPTED